MSTPNAGRIFNRSGLASLSDLRSCEYHDILAKLEKEQEAFLDKEPNFRSREYKWPRDPLHTWSRVWEYPYVYYHLVTNLRTLSNHPKRIVADIGSGVTFFPFALAKLGYQVVCADLDPVCKNDLSSAIRSLEHSPGKIEFRLISKSELPFEDAECDAVYCISVLEHIQDFEATIIEMARVIKPGGLCLITCDMDLDPEGNKQFNVMQYKQLLSVVGKQFCYFCPDQTIHPVDLLTTKNSPYPLGKSVQGFFRNGFFVMKQKIIKPLLGRKPHNPIQLCVLGLALKKLIDL